MNERNEALVVSRSTVTSFLDMDEPKRSDWPPPSTPHSLVLSTLLAPYTCDHLLVSRYPSFSKDSTNDVGN